MADRCHLYSVLKLMANELLLTASQVILVEAYMKYEIISSYIAILKNNSNFMLLRIYAITGWSHL
jgi:hypothetical protein